MSNEGAIGLFDSGLGGLTVFREVRKALPGETVIYYGDTAHVPYGARSVPELIELAGRIMAFLVQQKCKYIIFACNTSSALSLPLLRQRYDLPMIGLIEPGAAAAWRLTRNKKVGVMATAVTVQTGAYEKALLAWDSGLKVISRATPLLVPLVESGALDAAAAATVVRESLLPWRDTGIDTMLLGCTHYPFLTHLITAELGPEVRLVDPAGATVDKAVQEMTALGLMRSEAAAAATRSGHRFVVSGDPEDFREKAHLFMGRDIGPVRRVVL